MPQRLKPEIRAGIVAAAAAVFAEKGYTGARLSDIAAKADLSTGNIYKYFGGKDDLFNDVVTPPTAARLLRLLRARVRELGTMGDWPAADAQGSRRADALLSFWIEQRLAVLILLDGSDGTRYEHVRVLIAREMERLAVAWLRERQGPESLTPEMVFVIRQTFDHTVGMIAAILRHSRDADSIRRAFGLFWRYQLAGLQALFRS